MLAARSRASSWYPERMVRQVWRMLAPLLPSRRSAVAVLVVSSLVSAFLEAAVLVLVVSITLAIAAGKNHLAIHLPLLADAGVRVAVGLGIAAIAALVSLLAHALIARLGASLAAGTMENAR